MKLVWLPTARRERESQIAYIGEQNPAAAIEIGATIFRAVENLLEFPQMGRLGRVRGIRELVVSGTPFLVVYRLQPDSVYILRLLHGAQNWPDRH